jgi:Flp pilus assembly protein CpaB
MRTIAAPLALILAAAALASSVPESSIPDDSVETVDVLVARDDIKDGQPLDAPEHLFRKVRYFKGCAPSDAVLRYEDVEGRCLEHPLALGQMLQVSDFLPPGADLHPTYRRKMTVEAVRDPRRAVHPKDRVDIMFINGKTQESTLMQKDVLVLAVERSSEAEAGERLRVTLWATPEQREEFALYQSLVGCCLVIRAKDK